MLGRQYTAKGQYRYGFNGKENDNETFGNGDELDYGGRIYDPRLGKWLSMDKDDKLFTSWSPYNFTQNSPIRFKDINGHIQVDQHGNVIAPLVLV